MAISSGKFREEYQRCTWIFDFFAYGFDFLNGRFFPRSDPALEDMWDSAQEDIKRYDIEAQIVSADGAIPDMVKDYLDFPGGDATVEAPEFYTRLFSILSAIDRAAADLNYLGAYIHQRRGRWAKTSDHFERKKHLQQNAQGSVIFKSRYFKQAPSQMWVDRALTDEKIWKKIPPRGEALDTYFENLLRLSAPGDCEVDCRILSATQDFQKLDWINLRIGIVPLIEQLVVRSSDAQLLPGPLVIKKGTTALSTFGIHVEGAPAEACADLCRRAENGLRYLAEKGCQMVLFPEMVVPDPVVAHLKKVLRELALRDQPRPGLVLGGTFTRPVPRYSSSQPYNVAIVLSHCGEELWRQRKMQPYDMKRHEQAKFKLEPILDSDSCRENIAFSSRKLRVVDSPATGLRMVVLICEDATRDPGLRAVRELQPNLILAPVMAGPLEPDSGFGDSVTRALQETPAIFVVANSAALARAVWGSREGRPPLAIVGLPLLNVSNNFRPLTALRELERVPAHPSLEVLIYQFPA